MKKTIKYLKSRSKAGKTVTPLKLYPSEFHKLTTLGFYEVHGKQASGDEKHQAWYTMSCDESEPGTLAAKMRKIALKVRRQENRKRIQQTKHKNIQNIIKFKNAEEQNSSCELYDDETNYCELYGKELECCGDCEVCMFTHCDDFQFDEEMEMEG
jgi:hypothetical protein